MVALKFIPNRDYCKSYHDLTTIKLISGNIVRYCPTCQWCWTMNERGELEPLKVEYIQQSRDSR